MIMEQKICSNCNSAYNISRLIKYKEIELCGHCRKYKKECSVCKIIHYKQGLTCSKECAYKLRQLSWEKTCGSKHNFCKESISRKKWENDMFLKEGIENVFQRDSVKIKALETLKRKYGSRFENKKFNNVSHTQKWKDSHTFNYIQKFGFNRWLDKEYNNCTDISIYYCNVWSFTVSELKSYGKEVLGLSYYDIKNLNKGKKFRDKLSIDHKFSISEGFKQNIPPEIIGSIINLDLINTCKNSSKNNKCSIELHLLINLYNENKKTYKENIQ